MTQCYDVTLCCGCVVGTDPRGYPAVAFCPTHAAAPELLEACKALLAVAEKAQTYVRHGHGECQEDRANNAVNNALMGACLHAKAAIAKATGK